MFIDYGRRFGKTLAQNIEMLVRVNYFDEKVCIICRDEESKQRRKESLLEICEKLNLGNLKLPELVTMEELKKRGQISDSRNISKHQNKANLWHGWNRLFRII